MSGRGKRPWKEPKEPVPPGLVSQSLQGVAPDPRVLSRWCPGGVPVVSLWCPGGVLVVSRWCPGGVPVASLWCPRFVPLVSRLCLFLFSSVAFLLCTRQAVLMLCLACVVEQCRFSGGKKLWSDA